MKQKILIINREWPEELRPVQAATLVSYQIISEFSKRPNLDVWFLKISLAHETAEMDEIQLQAKQTLESRGVTYLDPIYLPQVLRPRHKVLRLLCPASRDFYPYVVHREIAYAAAKTFEPTALVTPWCEFSTHLFSEFPVKKFTYYGNADPLVARIWSDYINGDRRGTLKNLAHKINMKNFEKIHLKEINKWNFIGSVSLNMAEYYEKKLGHKAFYVNNLWTKKYGNCWESMRKEESLDAKLRIVGNIGSLAASANTMGLEIIARDILPELRKVLPDGSFEIAIYGRHDPLPHITKLLNEPEIKIKGFVEDLDSELLKSQIFLCVNNMSNYKTGHTRFLHAWSLGCCVVAHADAALSMPEICHNHNALLGTSASEIAKMIFTASRDKTLRYRLGEQGYNTLNSDFRVETIIDIIIEKLDLLS